MFLQTMVCAPNNLKIARMFLRIMICAPNTPKIAKLLLQIMICALELFHNSMTNPIYGMGWKVPYSNNFTGTILTSINTRFNELM